MFSSVIGCFLKKCTMGVVVISTGLSFVLNIHQSPTIDYAEDRLFTLLLAIFKHSKRSHRNKMSFKMKNLKNYCVFSLSRPTLTMTQRNLTGGCNVNCGCKIHEYAPVCGSDGITYFNPCLAGCNSVANDSTGVRERGG